jgi:hypothetical protein
MMDLNTAIGVIESCSGFTDESTMAGEAWEVILQYLRQTAIPVTERKPEDMQRVHHCYQGVRDWMYGIYVDGKFYERAGPRSYPATHWHPGLRLPEAGE